MELRLLRKDLHPDKDAIHVAKKLFCVGLQVFLIKVKFQLHSR